MSRAEQLEELQAFLAADAGGFGTVVITTSGKVRACSVDELRLVIRRLLEAGALPAL